LVPQYVGAAWFGIASAVGIAIAIADPNWIVDPDWIVEILIADKIVVVDIEGLIAEALRH